MKSCDTPLAYSCTCPFSCSVPLSLQTRILKDNPNVPYLDSSRRRIRRPLRGPLKWPLRRRTRRLFLTHAVMISLLLDSFLFLVFNNDIDALYKVSARQDDHITR